MKLFTKQINDLLFKQYPLGSNLEKQKVVAKIFNPYGAGRWYLINSDPSDSNYLWAIVEMNGNIEIGSVFRNELESIRLTAWRFPLERDLGFTPKNAKEVYDGLLQGKRFDEGGKVEESENYEMLKSQAKEIGHHTQEINSILKSKKEVEPWVVAKAERSATDLSDITHYLDGKEDEKYARGGEFGIDKHRIYFSTFGEVMDAIEDIAKENGYKIVDIFPDLSYGGVGYGQTKRAKVELEWDGVEKKGKSIKRQNNSLNVQIYRMDSGSYELNSYFSYEDGGYMAKGGDVDGVDLFEDYDEIPSKVQKVLDKYADGFEDGNYKILEKAKKDLEKIGYTFEYGLDGQAYDLRKVGQKGKSEMADGGYMEKGGMSDNLNIYIDYNRTKPYEYDKVTNMLTLKALQKNGLIEFTYNTGKDTRRYARENDKLYSGVEGMPKYNRPRDIKSAVKPSFSYKNTDYFIGYEKGINFLKFYVLKKGNDWDKYNKQKMADGGYMAKGGEIGVTYYIGRPEVDSAGRFGKKIATWKTCVVDENGQKKYGSQSVTIRSGSASNYKVDGIKITQKEFDKLDFGSKMADGGYMEKGGEIFTYPNTMREYFDEKKNDWVREPLTIKMGQLVFYYHSPQSYVEAKFLGKFGDKAKIEILHPYRPFTRRVEASYVSPMGRTQAANFLEEVTRGTIKKVSIDKIEIADKLYIKGHKLQSPEFKEEFSSLDNKMADGGYMEKGGEGSNLWVIYTKEWLKKPEIIEEFTATHTTARKKLKKYQESKPNSDIVYLMTDKVNFYELYGDEMAKGGTTFEGKVKSIKSSLLERKKVSPSVQKDYGKTYSPKEAEESAKRIVGAMTARERMNKKIKSKK